LRYAEQKDSIAFTKTARYFGSNREAANQTWNEIIKPFVKAGMINPIVKREKTEWSTGFTTAAVLALLGTGQNIDSRYIPPYSPPAPFESLPVEQGEPAEPAQNQQEQVENVFARDTEGIRR